MSSIPNGPRRTYIGTGSTPEAARSRLNPELTNLLATRLHARELWLLEILHEHRVLTTTQIQQLAFNTISATTHRMLTIWRLRGVERFRPAVPAGSAPWHYVLGPAGAAILTEHRPNTQINYRADTALAISRFDKLTHLVGSNGIFTALIHHARTHPHTQLDTWWSERRCAQTWGKIVRPDGYGRWHEHNQQLDFFTEYDTGTETLRRLLGKIGDYTALAEMTGIHHTPVLFALPNTTREQHLHTRTQPTAQPVATTTPQALQAAGSPAEAAWWPIGTPEGTRHRLVDLVPARTSER